MTTTPRTLLVLLGLLLQAADAQTAQSGPQSPTAGQKAPVEDPLGRGSPHGTVTGLVAAAERENPDRAAITWSRR
jgi:hypothetical protein